MNTLALRVLADAAKGSQQAFTRCVRAGVAPFPTIEMRRITGEARRSFRPLGRPPGGTRGNRGTACGLLQRERQEILRNEMVPRDHLHEWRDFAEVVDEAAHLLATRGFIGCAKDR